MITEEILLQNGYKKFENTWAKNTEPDTYICSYQKRFDDEVGQKYFITLNLHDYTKLKIYCNHWSVHSNFNIPKSEELCDEETFNIEYFVYYNTTIQMVESFHEKIWNVMGCRHYETWDEC